jgi:hypothetical protein
MEIHLGTSRGRHSFWALDFGGARVENTRSQDTQDPLAALAGSHKLWSVRLARYLSSRIFLGWEEISLVVWAGESEYCDSRVSTDDGCHRLHRTVVYCVDRLAQFPIFREPLP